MWTTLLLLLLIIALAGVDARRTHSRVAVSAEMLKPGDIILDRYQIVEKLESRRGRSDDFLPDRDVGAETGGHTQEIGNTDDNEHVVESGNDIGGLTEAGQGPHADDGAASVQAGGGRLLLTLATKAAASQSTLVPKISETNYLRKAVNRARARNGDHLFDSTEENLRQNPQNLERLGEGGYGVVFKAYDKDNGNRPVAVKFLVIPDTATDLQKQERLEDNKREVEMAQKAWEKCGTEHSQNLLEVIDTAEDSNGGLVMVTPFYDEGDMLDLLVKTDTLFERTALVSRLIPQIGGVLKCLGSDSEPSIVHLDLKPENVMITKSTTDPGELEAVLVDFGVSRLLPSTGHDYAIGTDGYMAPEVALTWEKNISKWTAAADVFSLGALALNMLLGKYFVKSSLETCLDFNPIRNIVFFLERFRYLKECFSPQTFARYFVEFVHAIIAGELYGANSNDATRLKETAASIPQVEALLDPLEKMLAFNPDQRLLNWVGMEDLKTTFSPHPVTSSESPWKSMKEELKIAIYKQLYSNGLEDLIKEAEHEGDCRFRMELAYIKQGKFVLHHRHCLWVGFGVGGGGGGNSNTT